MAKRCMLDWLGIAIRGSRETPSSIIRETIVEPGGQQATVFSGTGLKGFLQCCSLPFPGF